ncbi:hypothetical protein pEaSNUABM54_00255 [Erwinia phage pEa_SNUABM_54]|nr:hypothetical protein pEaSNUABM54_00255 [Erwinia phage pEa_SNUABM_54]
MLEKQHSRILEVVNGLIAESKLLDVKYGPDELPELNTREYISELLTGVGFKSDECRFEYMDSYIGNIVRFTVEDAIIVDLPASVAIRAMIYSKLLVLGSQILEQPDELLDDKEIEEWMLQIAQYFKLTRVYDSKEVVTALSGTKDVADAYMAAFFFWSDDKSLYDVVRQIATLYLPSNGFRRETILKRAIIAFNLLKKENAK